MSEQAERKRFRITHLAQAKAEERKLTMLTAYDAPTARILDSTDIDMLLVGDSIGNTMLGYRDTIPVTVDQMIVATRAVVSATKFALVVADMPFGSYEGSPEQALATATRLFKESGAHAVKLEGGRRIVPQVKLMTDAGIPVIGHLGFTPQSEHALGGKRVQGRGEEAAEEMSEDALALQEAGASAIVIEMTPSPVAARITEILHIPTIGIGAGPECDGQVLVWLDMAGMDDWSPRFSKTYGQVGAALRAAAQGFAQEVRGGVFPGPEHSFES